MKSSVVDCPLLVILPHRISHEVIFVEYLLLFPLPLLRALTIISYPSHDHPKPPYALSDF